MESTVLVDPGVREELRKLVLVRLFTDGSDPQEQTNLALALDRFGSGAIPGYYLLRADGSEISRVIGMTSSEEFLEFLGRR